MIILVYVIFELQIPTMTDEAIFPVPINPSFILLTISIKRKYMGKKKAPNKLGAFKFDIKNVN